MEIVSASRSTEEFSYFTLRRKETAMAPATSLFGIACSRQIDSKLLIHRPPDVTRSTVQKAVVVVTDSPQRVGQLREKLSVVTSAWFAQRYVGHIYGWCLCLKHTGTPNIEATYIVISSTRGLILILNLQGLFGYRYPEGMATFAHVLDLGEWYTEWAV